MAWPDWLWPHILRQTYATAVCNANVVIYIDKRLPVNKIKHDIKANKRCSTRKLLNKGWTLVRQNVLLTCINDAGEG